MSRHTENKEEILKIYGELKVINTKLDNHIVHLTARINTIYKIIWAVGIMALGNLLGLVKWQLWLSNLVLITFNSPYIFRISSLFSVCLLIKIMFRKETLLILSFCIV